MNKNTNLWNRVSIACCSALLLSASSVGFSAPRAEHIAAMHFSAEDGEVWWEPSQKTKYGFIQVSLSGPEGDVSGMFPYGEEPYFASMGDGLYKYELYRAPKGTAMSAAKGPDKAKSYVTVDRNGRSEQQRAERAPDQENSRRGFSQTGSFRIENGELVDPTIPEA